MIGSKAWTQVNIKRLTSSSSHLECKMGNFSSLFSTDKPLLYAGMSVCRLNFKTVPDTEALSHSSWWQNDEQLALQQNTRPIQRQITHRGRCAQAMYNEWTSERGKKQSEHWTRGIKRWPWQPVKRNSLSQWAFTCAAQSQATADFYGLVFHRLRISYITAKLKAK